MYSVTYFYIGVMLLGAIGFHMTWTNFRSGGDRGAVPTEAEDRPQPEPQPESVPEPTPEPRSGDEETEPRSGIDDEGTVFTTAPRE